MKHICIVGGGFSGCVTAINLSRLANGPLKITIINKGFPLGRGIAYSTRNGNHLLNVAARNMSALADQPTHFVEWLQTRSEYSEEPVDRLRERFMPRRVYGDYLHSLLFSRSSVATEKKIHIESIASEATDISHSNGSVVIKLANGDLLSADKVVLATGNQPPGPLKLKGLDPAHPRYFANPWTDWQSQLTDPAQNVILIGTGLTMIDAFISLKDLGWKGRIYALSRNGLLPLSHFKGMEYAGVVDDKTGALTLAEIFHRFKKQTRAAKSEGINPAILVDKMRPFTQGVWQNFSLAEKKRFNRHMRTRWNVVRHRIAQSIHEQLMEAAGANRLEIVKGRLCEVKSSDKQFVVTVKTGKTVRQLEAGALINCTGPSESFLRSSSSFYSNLIAKGLVQADEMDMGIKITPDFAVVDKNGKVSESVFALGPVLKGTLWESSAVPELRSQTFRVAEFIAKHLGADEVAIKESAEAVQEYEI